MAIEIVDLPIKSGDCPSFFCMFTRGYLQGWNDFVPSVSPSSRHPGPPYPSGGGKRHFRPPRPWTTWYHWNMAFTNVIQWRVANIGFTSQELLNCNSWLYVCIRDIYIYVCVHICIYIYIVTGVGLQPQIGKWDDRQSRYRRSSTDGAASLANWGIWKFLVYQMSIRLVGGIPWLSPTYPSEKWWSESQWMMTLPIYGKIIQM